MEGEPPSVPEELRFYIILQREVGRDFVFGARECLHHVGH